MNEYIGEYRIVESFSNRGAGMSRWAIAEKGDRKFFIKELLEPKYPQDDAPLSPDMIRFMREECDAFFKRRSRYYELLASCDQGNNVIVRGFFRHMTKYYVLTDYISATNLTPQQISALDPRQKMIIIKVILSCISMLHEAGLVHSDIKMDNILIKQTVNKHYTAKIIDFDSGFLSAEPPGDDDELVGDQVYFAPETIQRLSGEKVVLSEKIDIFALGIVIHQIWCGELPRISPKNGCAAVEVLNEDFIDVNYEIPEKLRGLVKLMLSKAPELRPSARDALSILSGTRLRKDPVWATPEL